jgi:hypothetical protein
MGESWILQRGDGASVLNLRGKKWETHGFERAQVEQWGREPDLAHVLAEALADFGSRMGAVAVGDKWPWYIDHLDTILEAFPKAKLIYNVRDPRGIWNSAQKFKGRKRGDAVLREMLAKDRKIEALGEHSNLFSFRYEDLVCDPEATARALYEFLGLDYDPSYLDYDAARDPLPERWSWVKEASDPFDPRHTTKWREAMTQKQIDRVSRQARSFISKYDYGGQRSSKKI